MEGSMKSAIFALVASVFSMSPAFADDCNILNPIPVDQWNCGFQIGFPYADIVQPVKIKTVKVAPTASDRAVEYLSETLVEIDQNYIEDRITGFKPD